MRTIEVRGRVFSGEGVGSQYISIQWVREQIQQKLGFDPFPGTLNVRLKRADSGRLKTAFGTSRGISLFPPRGYLSARCFRVSVMSKIDGAIVIPEKQGYPPDILEIAAPVSLREHLSLRDGDEVEMAIFLDENPKV
jgi:riboflavin kinase